MNPVLLSLLFAGALLAILIPAIFLIRMRERRRLRREYAPLLDAIDRLSSMNLLIPADRKASIPPWFRTLSDLIQRIQFESYRFRETSGAMRKISDDALQFQERQEQEFRGPTFSCCSRQVESSPVLKRMCSGNQIFWKRCSPVGWRYPNRLSLRA